MRSRGTSCASRRVGRTARRSASASRRCGRTRAARPELHEDRVARTGGALMALGIRKGDEVLVIAGKDRGKQGRVTEVRPSEKRVVVEGINIAKRHRKGNPSKREQAGIIDLATPMD